MPLQARSQSRSVVNGCPGPGAICLWDVALLYKLFQCEDAGKYRSACSSLGDLCPSDDKVTIGTHIWQEATAKLSESTTLRLGAESRFQHCHKCLVVRSFVVRDIKCLGQRCLIFSLSLVILRSCHTTHRSRRLICSWRKLSGLLSTDK